MSNPTEVMRTETIPERPTKQRLFLIAILCIGLFVCFLDRVNISVLVANDAFLMDMGIKGQPVKIGMLMSVFLAVYGVSNFVLSPIGDYLGPRKAMSLCVALWALSLCIGGLAATFTTMLVARVILGMGEGLYYPLQSVFVKNWIPTKERGRANAAWSIGQSLAPAVAMPLFAYVVGAYGWRDSFGVAFAITLIPLYLFWFHTTDTPRTHKKVNALELNYIEEGIAQEQQGKEVVTGTFYERFMTFAGNYRYWLLVIWYMLMNIIAWAMLSWLPTYLKAARGFSWAEMGWLASLPFVIGVLMKVITGWLTDRTGRSAPLLAGCQFLVAICMYFAAAVSGKYAAAMFLTGAVAFNVMAIPAAWTLLQGLVPSKTLGTAGGVMNGISTGMSALSPILIGYVISLGDYSMGLYALVAVAILASASAAVLACQKY